MGGSGLMYGGKGMSPRKAMGTGASAGGDNFGVPGYGFGHKVSPNATSGVGRSGALADAERGIGLPIMHAKGHLPAQAAPHHGPHHEAELGYSRGGKA